MQPRHLFLSLTIAGLCWAPTGEAASIAGTVTDPGNAALRGAFVAARDAQANATFIAVSDGHGHYRLVDLPAGRYTLSAKATGYRGDVAQELVLGAAQDAAQDIALKASQVRWNEISVHQARILWPASPAKDKIFAVCFTCHAFQTRMASAQHDTAGWRALVRYMQTAMRFGLADRLNDAQGDEIAAYLASLFSEHSVLPKSPADMPAYRDTVRPVSDQGLQIRFVEYDMPGPSRMPFSAAPDGQGHYWIPEFGVANRIGRLDPHSGAIQDFLVPNSGTAAIHSAVPAADGSVWLTEQGANKIGRWDPQTQKITEFQDAYTPGKLGYSAGSKHTLRFDPDGNVWSSGDPLTRLDRRTHQFKRFEEVPSAYDVKEDRDGNIWFTRPDTSQIGRVDWKTLKVSLWTPPTPHSFPRRIDIDSDGIVWFGEFNAGNIGRFDPKTQTFREYPLPGPEPTPYGLGIDADHHIWYSSYNMDVLGRFDPKTGTTVEYPFPHAENTIRELFRDAQGRMWYGSPSNNKVGYFTLTGAG